MCDAEAGPVLSGTFGMYEFFTQLLQPFTLLWFVLLLAVINLWRKRRETRRRLLLVTIPFALLTVLSLPWVSYLALGSLEWQTDPLEEIPPDVQAVVVLGGGYRQPDADNP